MAKYHWDLKELITRLNLLQGCLETEKDTNARFLILEHIELYHRMIKFTHPNLHRTNFLYKKQDEILLESGNDFFNLIASYIEDIKPKDLKLIDLVLNSFPFIKDFKLKEEEIPIWCSDDSLVRHSEDFLEKFTDEKLYLDYQTFKKENPNFLHIRYSKEPVSYNGVTLIDPLLHKKYILILRRNTLIDLTCLPHELFHLLLNDFDSLITYNNQNYYTTEIEGCLANFLVADFYKEKSEFLGKSIHNFFLTNYKELVFSLLTGVGLLQSCRDNGHLREHKFKKTINYFDTNYQLGHEYLNYLSEFRAAENTNYTLSYLAALDLYTIYQEDKELALYLLKNIRFFKRDDDVLNNLRRNHITFMDDEYSNLKQYVKRIDK